MFSTDSWVEEGSLGALSFKAIVGEDEKQKPQCQYVRNDFG